MRRRRQPLDYRDAVLALNPVGYWRLGEVGGSAVARNESGVNHATYVGAPTLGVPGALTGDANTAATLNGTNQLVRTGTDFPAPDGGISIGFWVKAAPQAAGNHYIGLRYKSGVEASWQINAYDTGAIGMKALASDNSDNLTLTSGTTILNNAWRFVCYTYDGGAAGAGLKAYIDNAAPATGAGTLDTLPWGRGGGAWIGIGANPDTGNYFAGSLDEFFIVHRVLTPDEIARLYRVGRGF